MIRLALFVIVVCLLLATDAHAATLSKQDARASAEEAAFAWALGLEEANGYVWTDQRVGRCARKSARRVVCGVVIWGEGEHAPDAPRDTFSCRLRIALYYRTATTARVSVDGPWSARTVRCDR